VSEATVRIAGVRIRAIDYRPRNSDITVSFRFAPEPGATTPPPTSPGAGGGLPVTGTATAPLVLGGIALLLIGTGAVWFTRRRRA